MRDPLISTAELANYLGEADLRVIDGSWFMDGRDARAAWRETHIPKAVFFDIDEVANTTSPLPHMLPSPEKFAQAAGDLGVSETDRIVIYDQQGLFSAARVWWTFRAMGALNVQVLDGGLPKWVKEKRPIESGGVGVRPALFQPRFRPALIRSMEAVAQELAGREQVVDARPAPRFRGEAPEPRQGLRSGHMPGARNIPFAELLNRNGTMKSAPDLAAIFAEAGVDPGRPVTTTCGSGVTASIVALALARLGQEAAAVYDGAWAEWGSPGGGEVVTGPTGT